MELTELLAESGIRYVKAGEHHHARYGWYQVDCPNCSPDSRKYRMGININGKYCNCWKCGSMSLAKFLSISSNLTYREAAKKVGVVESIKVQDTSKVVGVFKEPPMVADAIMKPHRKYLRSRGFNPSRIERIWNVKSIGLCSRSSLSWRLYIPIEYQGEAVSWTTRSISPTNEMRYLSASKEEERFHHKDLLYGEDYCRSVIIICEGPTDAWRLGPSAVSTFGVGYSRKQLLRMTKYPTRVVCFDNSMSAQKRARELVGHLEGFPGRTFNVQLDAEDPGSASSREVKELRHYFGLA